MHTDEVTIKSIARATMAGRAGLSPPHAAAVAQRAAASASRISPEAAPSPKVVDGRAIKS